MQKLLQVLYIIHLILFIQIGYSQSSDIANSTSYTEICEDMKATNFEPQAYTAPSGSPSYMKLLPGSNNWMFFARDFESVSTSTIELNYLSRLNHFLQERGVTLIMLRLPQRAQLYSNLLSPEYNHLSYSPDAAQKAYEAMITEFNAIGIITPNLLAEFKNEAGEVYYPAENHWNTTGQTLAAKAIKQSLQDNQKYQDLPKTAFELSFSEPTPRAGFANWVKNICKTEVYQYDFTAASATPIDQTDSLNTLFETEKPPVVLVGTSQSKPRSNRWDFSAYIKEALSINVSNEAVGGSEVMSILDYFINSPNWLQHKPSFLIWETDTEPTVQVNSLRQILPAAHGSCTEELLLDGGSIIFDERVTAKLKFELDNEPELGIYLYLKADSDTNEFLGVDITYKDGHHELLHLGHPRITNSGTYFVEFLSGHGNVDSLELLKHSPSLIESLAWAICLPQS